MSAARDEEVCGETYDHDFPEPEFIDGLAVLVCRNCGGEIFEEESQDLWVEVVAEQQKEMRR